LSVDGKDWGLMNVTKAYMFAGIFLVCATSKLRAEFVSVVELTDLRGNASYKICTEDEKKKLETELKAEDKVYSKVLDETKSEWKTKHNDKPFPGGYLKPRTLRTLTTTSKREEAESFLSKREISEADTKKRNRKEEESILKKKAKPFHRGGNNNSSIVREKKEVKEDLQQEAEADKAEELLRKNLSAATGHEIPFFGEAPIKAQKKKAEAKKK
jgi:uncharacterized phage protein (TIGR02220 family)